VSGRPKRPALTSEEAARDAARELHAAIKDAWTVLRELQAERAAARDTARYIADETDAEIALRLAELTRHVSEQSGMVAEIVQGTANNLQQLISEILGKESPEDLLRSITASLLADIGPAVVEAVTQHIDDQLPQCVTESLIDIAEHGVHKKHRDRAAESLALGTFAVAFKNAAVNGAKETAPGGGCP